MDVREGLQRILTSCSFVTKDCLQMCVNQLLDSLKKYPQVIVIGNKFFYYICSDNNIILICTG